MKRIVYPMFRPMFCAVACLIVLAGLAYGQTPPPPLDLTAQVTNQFPPGVELKWKIAEILPPIPPTVYKVYRSVDDSVSFSLLNVTDSRTEYNDRQVTTGHTYYYQVTTVWIFADSSVHESARSNTAWAVLSPPTEATGEITGTVTDSVTGQPIRFARVLFYRPEHPIFWEPQTWSDSLGRYKAYLDTGTYLVNCQPPLWMDFLMSPVLLRYIPQWYKDAYSPRNAKPVRVSDGGVDSSIDFALARVVLPVPVHFKGTVSDSAGNPLKGALVTILRTVWEMNEIAATAAEVTTLPDETVDVDGLGCIRGVIWRGWTDSSGNYNATVLSQRSYVALAWKKGFMPQFFDHKSNPLEATVIRVTGDTSGIDFNLIPFHAPQLYSISGVVLDSAGVRVPSRIVVFPLWPRPRNAEIRFGFTDSLGNYAISKVRAGKYIVLAVPFGGYAPAFYKAGAFGVLSWKDADTVNVAGNVTDINIGVVKIHSDGVAELQGVITAGGNGLEGVNVLARNGDGTIVGYAMTDDMGAYTMSGLPSGQVTIAVDADGYNAAQQVISVASTDYALSQDFTLGTTTAVVAPQGTVPVSYALEQNYPNPFNPSTQIGFSLPRAGNVSVKVFNMLGQEVATLVSGYMASGKYSTVWDGRDAAGRVVASGVYFYRLNAAGINGGAPFTAIRKMVLLK